MTWKGIVFDLDNTLFSHEKAFKKAINECFLTYLEKNVSKEDHVPYETFFPVFKKKSDDFWNKFEKKEVSGNEYRRLRFNESMKVLDLPYSDKLADEFHTHYYKVVDKYSEAFPGVHELLSYLHKKQVKLAIITNGTIDTQYNKVKKIGVGRWIDEKNIIVSEEVGYAKPAREIFQLVEEKLELLPEDLLYIGDSWKHDVAGAIEAGWDAIYLNSRKESPSNSKNYQPLAEYYSMEECKGRMMNML